MTTPTLKQRIRNRERIYGVSVGVPSAAIVEMVGHAGFDYVMIDCEHGAMGLDTLEHLLRAADAAHVAPIVRIPTPDAAEILHVLDAGAHGIIVPHVRTADDARAIVSRAHYPPGGERGIITMSRAARYGIRDKSTYFAEMTARTLVILLVEDAVALPHVREIAGVPGVDAVFVGPTDLAGSMGHAADPRHPEVIAALEQIRLDVLAANGPALLTIARTEADVPAALAQGFTMLSFSTTYILGNGLVELRATLPR